jgi:hypothetical protein
MNTTRNTKETATNIPEVGMGATINSGSDSYPATVSRISKSGKRLWVKMDSKMVLEGTWETGGVNYVTMPNEDAEEREYSLRPNGSWIMKGVATNARYGSLTLGIRRYNQDPSF